MSKKSHSTILFLVTLILLIVSSLGYYGETRTWRHSKQRETYQTIKESMRRAKTKVTPTYMKKHLETTLDNLNGTYNEEQDIVYYTAKLDPYTEKIKGIIYLVERLEPGTENYDEAFNVITQTLNQISLYGIKKTLVLTTVPLINTYSHIITILFFLSGPTSINMVLVNDEENAFDREDRAIGVITIAMLFLMLALGLHMIITF